MQFIKIFELLLCFAKTELISFVELLVWLSIKESDIYQMFWSISYTRPTIMLSLLVLPVMSTFYDYQENKHKITQAWRLFWR
jgi:hypothetical protein